MIDRFLARVGTLGAIAILTVAVLATGIAGGVLEHVRLSAQHALPQQQSEQVGSQQGEAKQETQSDDQGDKQGDKTHKGTQSQDGEKGDHETEAK
jgi:hypothetical protein